MKTRRIQLIAGLAMFVLCISVCITTTSADEVWSEDFDVPPDDWTIFGYIYDGYPVPTEGNFSYASGMLEALDDDVNIARHESNTSVGTWSFDMFVPDDDDGEGGIYVEFMSNGSSFIEFGNASFVSVGAYLDEDKFVVWSIIGSSYQVYSDIHVDPMEGWHHIEVSRTSDGHFCVWFNGTPEAHFTNTAVTSSIYLHFLCNDATGAAIDNLVVDDIVKQCSLTHTTTTTTTTTPTTTPTPIDPGLIILIVGTGAGVVLIAIVVLRRR
jgi:hypothetical protein